MHKHLNKNIYMYILNHPITVPKTQEILKEAQTHYKKGVKVKVTSKKL